MAAFGPTTGQNLAAVAGGHAFSKSVFPDPDNVGRRFQMLFHIGANYNTGFCYVKFFRFELTLLAMSSTVKRRVLSSGIPIVLVPAGDGPALAGLSHPPAFMGEGIGR